MKVWDRVKIDSTQEEWEVVENSLWWVYVKIEDWIYWEILKHCYFNEVEIIKRKKK